MLKKKNNNWISKKLASSIAFLLGGYVSKYEYPTAYLLATSKMDKVATCRIARYLGLKVHFHNGDWQEKGISINEIIKTKQYGQEKEIKD